MYRTQGSKCGEEATVNSSTFLYIPYAPYTMFSFPTWTTCSANIRIQIKRTFTSTKEHNLDMETRYWSSYHSFVPSTRPYQAPNHATRGCCWKPQPRPHRSHVGPTNGSVDWCKTMEFCRNSWAVTPELMDFLQSLPSIHSMNQWIFCLLLYVTRKQRFFSPTFTGAYGASLRFSPKPVLSTEKSFTPWPPNILRGHFTNRASRRGITRCLKSKNSTICFTIQDMGMSVLIGEYSE